jgi:hypothetical protein
MQRKYYRGRKRGAVTSDIIKEVERLRINGYSGPVIAHKVGLSSPTIYKIIHNGYSLTKYRRSLVNSKAASRSRRGEVPERMTQRRGVLSQISQYEKDVNIRLKNEIRRMGLIEFVRRKLEE